jgi:hypothetical protein
MTMNFKLTVSCIVIGLGLAAGEALALDVAVAPSEGEATKEKLAAVDDAEGAALLAQGHKVFAASETRQIMGKLALKGVESLEDADLIGTKLKVQFVLVATVTPLAGQDTIEIRAYYLPEGRMELLEEVATEGETAVVVEGMVKRLVTKAGLSKETKPPPKEKEQGKEQEKGKGVEEQIGEITGGEGGEKGKEKGKEGGGAEDEKLLKDLQTWPEKKKQRIGYGVDYRISLELSGGPMILLNEPVKGGRVGGMATLALGYVAVPACGCDFGGEVRIYFGDPNPFTAFSLTAYAGFNFRLSPAAPVYLGGRLSLGYLKSISGARNNRMILRLAVVNLNIVLRGRFMILVNPVAFTMLAFEGNIVGLYDASVGFGVRF